MSCASALKRHVLVVAAMACTFALLFFILSVCSARLETFHVKLRSDEFPQDDPAAGSAVALQAPAMVSPLAALAQAWHTGASSLTGFEPVSDDDDVDPTGWMRLSLKLGYFRFCYSYKLHFDPIVTPSYNASAQDASISGCHTVAHKCEFNLMSVLEPRGYDPSTHPDEVVYQLEHLPLVGNCDLYNAARGFAVLVTLGVAATCVLMLLLWRRQVKVAVVAITAASVFVLALVCLALTVSVHQGDPALRALDRFAAHLPHSPSVGLGASFILLVVAIVMLLVATICIAVEARKRTQARGGRDLPYHSRQLQADDIGMVYQPGTAYRQF